MRSTRVEELEALIISLEAEREKALAELHELGVRGSTRGILSVDFDGVLHSYRSGWRGAAVISDGPVDGAFEFLREAQRWFRVAIFSSRNAQPGGVMAMRRWFVDHGLEESVLEALEFPVVKPPAHVTIDDRAIPFMGTFPNIEELRRFVPWNKIKRIERAG